MLRLKPILSVLPLILASLSPVFTWPQNSAATSFYERPFPESVKDAPVIVHGTIGSTYADWGHESDGGKRIYTYWELRVAEVLKGPAEGQGGLLRMREMGGEKDGVGMQVAGSATFGAGEEVVVFLSEKNSESSYDVWGMMMGRYGVEKDAEGHEFLTGAGINSLSKSRLYEDEGRTPSPAPKWTLDSLRRLIASQGDSPSPAAPVELKPRKSAAPRPSEAPLSPTSVSPAPSLQTPTEEASFPLGPVLGIAGAALAAVAFYFSRRRA